MGTYRKYENMTADEIISFLKDKYKGDKDKIAEIEMAEKNIAYIKKQNNYKGQTPWQCAVSLAETLDYWN